MDYHNDDNDPGLKLTPLGRRVIFGLLIIGILIALVILLTGGNAGAAPLEGNRGFCNYASRASGLACTVTDAGVGWVMGTCKWGEFFLAQTWRTFRPGQNVTVSGCEDQYGTLFGTPDYPLRVYRR